MLKNISSSVQLVNVLMTAKSRGLSEPDNVEAVS